MLREPGSGQLPLHQAVKKSYAALVKCILQHDQGLVTRENAMGQTPLELAEVMVWRETIENENPDILESKYVPLLRRKDGDFAEDVEKEANKKKSIEREVRETWMLCKSAAENLTMKRRLVSVNEAREVARRLAEKNKQKEQSEEESEGKKGKGDEVDGWLGYKGAEIDMGYGRYR